MFDDDKRRLAASLAHELGMEIPLAISESVPGSLPLTMDTPAELPALAPQGTMVEKTTISCDTHATVPVLPPMPDFPSSGSAQLPVMKRKRSLEVNYHMFYQRSTILTGQQEHTTGQQEHTDEASFLAHLDSSATTRFSEHVREDDVASSTKRTVSWSIAPMLDVLMQASFAEDIPSLAHSSESKSPDRRVATAAAQEAGDALSLSAT
jgi:hypothetical protein